MDFSLTEEQVELKRLARQILLDQTSNERLREIEALEDRFDEKLWNDLAAAGLLGIGIGEAYGGMGYGYESLCLLVEEVGYTVAPIPVVPVLVSAALPIDRFGSDEQKQRWLVPAIAGECLVAIAMTEPSVGSDLAGISTRAIRDGDHYVLNGSKTFISNGQNCDLVIVVVKTDPAASPPHDGMSLILIGRAHV